MEDLLLKLLIEGGSAAAVVVSIWMFLRHMREERKSRDQRDEMHFARLEALQSVTNEVVKDNTRAAQKMCDYMEMLRTPSHPVVVHPPAQPHGEKKT